MLLINDLKQAIEKQKDQLLLRDKGIPRHKIRDIDLKHSHIQIISGIRRCGKSTLLAQLASGTAGNIMYLNFEDQRIADFEQKDFLKLDELSRDNPDLYLFDEIQNVEGWEKYIRHLHDNGKKVIVTGSNASMLSRELGTKLTGRYITHHLFPFSYSEYLNYSGVSADRKSLEAYLVKGGFPEFLTSGNIEVIQQLFRDIIYRDIVARYGIRNTTTLMDIAIFIVSNSGKEYSFNSIKNSFNVGSANSVSDYINWLEDSYLIFSVPRFSWSVKQMAVNPKKAYAIDTGLASAISLGLSRDPDRMLENMVFLHLKRKNDKIFYFKEKYECDLLVYNNGAGELFQVCLELNHDNQEREVMGLVEALDFFNKKKGIILTMDQEDRLLQSGKEILVIPAWKWAANPDIRPFR